MEIKGITILLSFFNLHFVSSFGFDVGRPRTSNMTPKAHNLSPNARRPTRRRGDVGIQGDQHQPLRTRKRTQIELLAVDRREGSLLELAAAFEGDRDASQRHLLFYFQK